MTELRSRNLRAGFVRGDRLDDLRHYGSAARGEAGPESDLDLFAVIHGLTPEIELAILDAAFEIGLEHDTYLSPRIVGREVLETPLWRSTPFIRTVLSEGVPV